MYESNKRLQCSAVGTGNGHLHFDGRKIFVVSRRPCRRISSSLIIGQIEIADIINKDISISQRCSGTFGNLYRSIIQSDCPDTICCGITVACTGKSKSRITGGRINIYHLGDFPGNPGHGHLSLLGCCRIFFDFNVSFYSLGNGHTANGSQNTHQNHSYDNLDECETVFRSAAAAIMKTKYFFIQLLR
ncbi:hypothetical protein ASZ90_008564 [hydrocarbon metagenome]|uniref:Uncharacterized protein n=1 Tax=hydrocarbon metagenome TaxID=938273 RepID=A0A0W8FLI2_9ZZZZ